MSEQRDIVWRLRNQTQVGMRAQDEAADEIASLRAQLAEAVTAIKGVVKSYPVAAGTSKYGYEEEHDGYGSIRECRLFLEKFAPTDEIRKPVCEWCDNCKTMPCESIEIARGCSRFLR